MTRESNRERTMELDPSEGGTALARSPSSTRVAVIGCGYWGKNLVRNFAELGALEAIVDVDAETVKSLTGAFGGRALALKHALEDPSVQAVAIATPAANHFAAA